MIEHCADCGRDDDLIDVRTADGYRTICCGCAGRLTLSDPSNSIWRIGLTNTARSNRTRRQSFKRVRLTQMNSRQS